MAKQWTLGVYEGITKDMSESDQARCVVVIRDPTISAQPEGIREQTANNTSE